MGACAQVDGEFNFPGYVANAFIPGGIGVAHYHPRLHDDKHEWFCSQLVGCALQAMGDEEELQVAYVPPRGAHTARALWVLLAMVVGALSGAVVFRVVDGHSALGRTNAALLCALAALVTALSTGSVAAALGDWGSERAAFYRRLAERHDATRADWRSAVGSFTRWHQSSPNSMFDLLLCLRGVTDGRDPNGPKLSLGVYP